MQLLMYVDQKFDYLLHIFSNRRWRNVFDLVNQSAAGFLDAPLIIQNQG
jgi:hypothetical protein